MILFLSLCVDLMLLGFLSLLLTVGEKTIANICIPKDVGETFLPCNDSSFDVEEEAKCKEQVLPQFSSYTCLWLALRYIRMFAFSMKQGKVSLMSSAGVRELQYLIFVLAFFHSLSCILTSSLGMAKVNDFFSWFGLVEFSGKLLPVLTDIKPDWKNSIL